MLVGLVGQAAVERRWAGARARLAPVLKGRNYFVVECSAKTGKGLQDGMEWLVDQINKGE